MIQNGIHADYDDPPRVPQITGLKERPRKESLMDAVTGAAMAVAKVFAPATSATVAPSENVQAVDKSVLSPSTCTDLRMRNLEQLKLLQQLFVQDVLTETEYTEQKNIILDTLRNLK